MSLWLTPGNATSIRFSRNNDLSSSRLALPSLLFLLLSRVPVLSVPRQLKSSLLYFVTRLLDLIKEAICLVLPFQLDVLLICVHKLLLDKLTHK